MYRKRLTISLVLAVPYSLVHVFWYHIDTLFLSRYVDGGLQFAALTLFALCWITVSLFLIILGLKELWRLIKQYKESRQIISWPLIVCMTGLLLAHFSYIISSEKLESPIIYRAYIEGTVSHLIIKLRANSQCEINNSAVGISDYSYGCWRKSGDTIFIKEDGSQVLPSDTLLISGNVLDPINNVKDEKGGWRFRQFQLTE